MRPTEFPNESIIHAGLDLQAAGRNITGFALRQKVGGGNPTRLKQVWDEHQSSQSTSLAEPVAELPVEVAEEVAAVSHALNQRLASLAVDLNDKAVKAADRRVHEVVRNAGEQRAQAERELADAAATVDDLEAKLDDTQTYVAELADKLAKGQEVLQAQAVELATVKARADAAAAEALRTTERMTKAKADRDEASTKAATAREEAAGLRGQVAAMQAQIEGLTRTLATNPAK